MPKLKPKGFIAICQCDRVVGAMDYEATGRLEAGKLLGQWIGDGCIIKPKFNTSWSAHIQSCECETNVENR